MKRALSILLATVMVLGVMATAVVATPPNATVHDYVYEFKVDWDGSNYSVVPATPTDVDLGEIFRVEFGASGADLVIENKLQPQFRQYMAVTEKRTAHFTGSPSTFSHYSYLYDHYYFAEYRRRDIVLSSVQVAFPADDLTDWTNNIKLGPWHDLFDVKTGNAGTVAPGPMPAGAPSGATNWTTTKNYSNSAAANSCTLANGITPPTGLQKDTRITLLRYDQAVANKLYPKTGPYTVKFRIAFTIDATGTNAFAANTTVPSTTSHTGTHTNSNCTIDVKSQGAYGNTGTYLNQTHGGPDELKVTIWAAEETKQNLVGAPSGVYDDEGKRLNNNGGSNYTGEVSSRGNIFLDQVLPGQTIYIRLDNLPNMEENPTMFYGDKLPDASVPGLERFGLGDDLANSDYFKISTKKIKSSGNTNSGNDGNPLFKEVRQINNYKLDKSVDDYGNYLKVTFADTFAVDEKKGVIEVTFKAKGNKADIPTYTNVGDFLASDGNTYTTNWLKDDYAVLRITCWFNNTQVKGNDYGTSPGDKVVFDPVNNDDNSFTWDDDIAHLRFEASADANKFYTRLSTSIIPEVYDTYGDPAGADLWFWDFLAHPTISDTSRGYLTLGIPWAEDMFNPPNPETCFIYMWDGDELTDVTSQFKYSEDDEDIPGWTTKTRVLGIYVLSDIELDLDGTAALDQPVGEIPDDGSKVVANTGC